MCIISPTQNLRSSVHLIDSSQATAFYLHTIEDGMNDLLRAAPQSVGVYLVPNNTSEQNPRSSLHQLETKTLVGRHV